MGECGIEVSTKASLQRWLGGSRSTAFASLRTIVFDMMLLLVSSESPPSPSPKFRAFKAALLEHR